MDAGSQQWNHGSRWENAGNAANQFFDPTRIALFNGDLYIGDSQNNRVQKWTPGASSGVTVAGGNGMGSAANSCMDCLD